MWASMWPSFIISVKYGSLISDSFILFYFIFQRLYLFVREREVEREGESVRERERANRGSSRQREK